MSIQDLLIEVADDVRVRRYSGRYMYGRDCLAITGPFKSCMQTISEAIQREIEEVYSESADAESDSDYKRALDVVGRAKATTDTLLGFEQDNLGLDVVLYWPRIKWQESEDDQDQL
jgi:hypothetical protein